ncbi:YgjV family protein [Allorhizocola rhizosphaerae]|uniref:YgjV family protein n=1 Tax=Allorhizocola rhizosphaerae TaxID=1872709 RepID=UPI000E3B8D63|nr:YgjV family protein [Allorhizocola rhizosphaerae]
MNWLDAVGWAGSALLIWSLLQTRILRLRLFNLVGCLALIGYNAAIRVWPMVGLNVVLAIINSVYLIRLQRMRHDPQAYTVVEVKADDAFLHHLLAVHAEDITRFNPGFRPHAEQLAFVVMRHDEVVGIVLVRDAGGGVAQIDLDYVIGRYRDFTPGEFVYKRSNLFTDHGFRKVVTPPTMVAPYYENIGFKREGGSYSLTF